MPVINFEMPQALVEGIADFTTKAMIPKISKNGNKMLEVDLLLVDKNNQKESKKVFLLLDGAMKHKTTHYFESIGKLEEATDQLKQNIFNTDSVIGARGKCILKITHSEKYGTRMDVDDFCKPDAYPDQLTKATDPDDFKDDEIGF